MEVFALILRIFLAVVFLVAAVGKLLDRKGSEQALKDFEVPAPLIRPVAAFLPWIELAVAFSFLFVASAWFGSVAAIVLLASFTAGMLVQYFKGNAPDCHCFGQIHSEPVGVKSIIRNVLLALPAIVLAVLGRGAQGTELSGLDGNDISGNMMQLVIGALILALLTAVVFMLRKVLEQQAQVIRRIEILEVISSEGKEVTREEAMGNPHAGLPLGSPLPAIEMTDAEGRATNSNSVLSREVPSLVLFVGPNCHPCESLIPDIREWTSEFEGVLDFVLVSSGTVDENLKKFGEENSGRIFVQNDRSVADLLGAMWTPTAILVDSKGAIASRNAVGDSAIRELVDGLRSADVKAEYFHYSNGEDGVETKIGERIPEFSLSDLDGNEVASSGLSGKVTLAAFWSTTCPFCINMIEDLKGWYDSRSEGEPELLVFSDGDPEQHKALGLEAPILLEKEYATASKLGMNGTPSAVLIDGNGRIASETGVGADKIWALLGMTKTRNEDQNGNGGGD
jgi:thiol-disulfide isomerase/thioredoxin/uncharacterized membrane protein YphA (DoxX/SURF4 family)